MITLIVLVLSLGVFHGLLAESSSSSTDVAYQIQHDSIEHVKN